MKDRWKDWVCWCSLLRQKHRCGGGDNGRVEKETNCVGYDWRFKRAKCAPFTEAGALLLNRTVAFLCLSRGFCPLPCETGFMRSPTLGGDSPDKSPIFYLQTPHNVNETKSMNRLLYRFDSCNANSQGFLAFFAPILVASSLWKASWYLSRRRSGLNWSCIDWGPLDHLAILTISCIIFLANVCVFLCQRVYLCACKCTCCCRCCCSCCCCCCCCCSLDPRID